MIKSLKKNKKGAASFYIVAFSSLILVIIAASFATAVINEITRTANDDLSQSAYDSAMAGIEDAKLAYMNYQRCIESGKGTPTKPILDDSSPTCGEIVYYMENPDCYMVGHILGRIKKSVEYGKADTEVQISETVKGKNNNLQQAYTCVEIRTALDDYRATLSSTNNNKVVKVKLANGAKVNSIESVKIKWFSRSEQTGDFNFSNVVNNPSLKLGDKELNWRVAFLPANNAKAATPPTISVEMVQTANEFGVEDFTKVVRSSSSESGTANKTDRATLVMVPTGDADKADYSKYESGGDYYDSNYQWWGAYRQGRGENYFPSRWLVESNLAGSGHYGKNVPFLVYCPEDANTEFACSATIDLPGPVGGNGERNDETFMFVLTLPYGQPDTEFALEFICKNDANCNPDVEVSGSTTSTNVAQTAGMQVTIDSTGRANDLYRRVETRLEPADGGYVYALYGIQLLGKKNEDALVKNQQGVTSEYGLGTYDAYLNTLNSRLTNN